jgi:hypothetical protein
MQCWTSHFQELLHCLMALIYGERLARFQQAF